MKIRNGFVSNSSSSSFILFFKSVPTTVSEINDTLFSEYEKNNDVVYDDYSNCYPLSVVSKSVLENIKDNILDFDSMFSQLKDEFGHIDQYNVGSLDEFFYGHDYSIQYEILKNDILVSNDILGKKISELYSIYHKETDKDKKQEIRKQIDKLYDEKYTKQEEISNKTLALLYDILKEKYEGYKFSYVEYSDNDGDFCSFMEHGGVLDKISILRISHH